MNDASINQSIDHLGTELWAEIQNEAPGLFDSSYWQGQMLDWVMKDASFKTDMFRFVDVFPVLDGTDDIALHIREYLLKEGRELPKLMQVSLMAASKGLTAGLASKLIRQQVSNMAERFIVGQNAKSAIKTLRELYKSDVTFTADLLGEAVFSESEAEQYRNRYLDLVENLSNAVSLWKENDLLNTNHAGEIPPTNISLKISAFQPFLDAVDCDGAVDLLYEKIMPVLLQARKKNVFVNFDMEQWALHEISMRLFEKVCTSPELKDWPHLGIVIQAYLNSAHDDFDRLLDLAEKRQCPLTVRLVKGAYWDYETVHARQHDLPCPVIQGKSATDFQYEEITARLLDNYTMLEPAFATHNLRSIVYAIVYADNLGVPKNAYEFQMLYGMAEAEREVLKRRGYRI
ncbi:MAG: proline dehydrogenase family protein, partial [Lentisphaeria bacterium]|nr:proline dehydrogenase family protein [Lentisphaeria bacterium]NQZ68231.1 proline dehydrogenase family protein [Lentisphaeria bacterium]